MFSQIWNTLLLPPESHEEWCGIMLKSPENNRHSCTLSLKVFRTESGSWKSCRNTTEAVYCILYCLVIHCSLHILFILSVLQYLCIKCWNPVLYEKLWNGDFTVLKLSIDFCSDLQNLCYYSWEVHVDEVTYHFCMLLPFLIMSAKYIYVLCLRYLLLMLREQRNYVDTISPFEIQP
jgi:hypothetical protein